MMMTTVTTMLAELCVPVIELLRQQHVGRILDYHMGIYELEEGEIIDYDITLDDLRMIAERIVLGTDFHKVEEEEEDDDIFSDYENEEGEEDPKEDLYMHLYME
jgi:hypothetical protein